MTETRTSTRRIQPNDLVDVSFTQNGETRKFTGIVLDTYQSGDIAGGFTIPMLSVQCDDGITRSITEGHATLRANDEPRRYVVRQLTVVASWDVEETETYILDTVTNQHGVCPLGKAGAQRICDELNAADDTRPVEELGQRVARLAQLIVGHK